MCQCDRSQSFDPGIWYSILSHQPHVSHRSAVRGLAAKTNFLKNPWLESSTSWRRLCCLRSRGSTGSRVFRTRRDVSCNDEDARSCGGRCDATKAPVVERPQKRRWIPHHGMTFKVSSVATTWTGPAITETRCALSHSPFCTWSLPGTTGSDHSGTSGSQNQDDRQNRWALEIHNL